MLLLKDKKDKEANEKQVDYVIVASRGRDPDDPSNRRAGCTTVQRIEPNMNGTTNTITSVQKDNWVLEIKHEVHEM